MTSWSSALPGRIWRWSGRTIPSLRRRWIGVDILHYLDDTLDRQYPISGELHRLYDFFCYDFSRVKAGRNREELGKLRPMIADLRESFRSAEKATAATR